MVGLTGISLYIRLALAAAAAGAVAFATFQVVHAFDTVKLDQVVSTVKDGQIAGEKAGRAADAKQADISIHSAAAEADAQAQLAASATVIKQKVHKHVTAPPSPPTVRGCITYGLVRAHDAAALGVDPDTLALPAGTADDACAPVADADLADALSDNYAAARANAEQLEALEADVRKRVDATAPPK
jgi:hypothetical protein